MIPRSRWLRVRVSGMALIAVLLVLTVLAGLIIEMHYQSRVALCLAQNLQQSAQALCCAEAGLALAMGVLEQYDQLTPEQRQSPLMSDGVRVPVGEGYCTVSLASESGKININTLKLPNGQMNRPRIDEVLRLIDLLNAQTADEELISYGLVPSMIDWVDADDEVAVLESVRGDSRGAENEYYRGLDPPYPCKNRPFDTLGELALVKGGKALQRKALPGAGRLESYLTVYGEGGLSLNDAEAPVIETLSDRIDAALAQAIVQYRPYKRWEDLKTVPGMTEAVYEQIRRSAVLEQKNQYYMVTATGAVGQAVRAIRGVVQTNRASGRLILLVRWEL
jgi:general secretion pathway protein K